MTLDQALADLQKIVDLTVEPELTETDAKNALESSLRYGDRGATAAYGSMIAVGGRLYRCAWDGGTSETLPTRLGRTCVGTWVPDGTAQWEDIGPRPANNYDLMGAKWYLYDLRVQRSAELINQGDKDFKQDAESIHDHWVKERSKIVRICAV